MNKAVLISIQPKWCELKANGKKTIEVRKSCPSKTPFKSYIYCTKKDMAEPFLYYGKGGKELATEKGKVIGEFLCDRIEKIEPCFEYYSNGYDVDDDMLTYTCLTREELMQYGKGATLYGWHITDLVIYDKPKELREFWAYNNEWHKRFGEQYDYCCYNATTNSGEAWVDCAGYEGVYNCYRCWEEWSGWCHRLTRPPQSWCYVEKV